MDSIRLTGSIWLWVLIIVSTDAAVSIEQDARIQKADRVEGSKGTIVACIPNQLYVRSRKLGDF